MSLLDHAVITAWKAKQGVTCLTQYVNGKFSGDRCTGDFSSIYQTNEDFDTVIYPSLPNHTKEFLRTSGMSDDLMGLFSFAYEDLLEKIDIQSLFIMICRFSCNQHVQCAYAKVEWLVKKGLDPSCTEYRKWFGTTPMMACSLNYDGVMMEKLFGYKVDPNVQTSDKGMSALMLAAQNDSDYCVEALVKGGANINLVDNRGFTALHYACCAGSQLPLENYKVEKRARCVKFLVDAGADMNLKSNNGSTPASLAHDAGYVKVLDVLNAQVPQNI